MPAPSNSLARCCVRFFDEVGVLHDKHFTKIFWMIQKYDMSAPKFVVSNVSKICRQICEVRNWVHPPLLS